MDEFENIGAGLGAERAQFFGKPCFKTGGKAFCAWFEDEMVFKLPREMIEHTLAIEGATRFDPSKEGRPMKEWIQVPASAKAQWSELAFAAFEYVDGK